MDEIQNEIKERLSDLKDEYSKTYERVEDNLQFESGHSDDLEERGSERSNKVLNYMRKYTNRIVNPFINNKINVEVSSGDEEKDKIVNYKLNELINNDSYRESKEVALRTAVISGYGFGLNKTSYLRDDSLTQKITNSPIYNPTSVYLGSHENVDGSDAEYGVVFDHIDKKTAVKKHGDEVLINEFDGSMYSGWCEEKANEVPELTYFYKTYQSTMRTFFSDGRHMDGFEDSELTVLPEGVEILDSREIKTSYINVIKYIGAKEVYKTKYKGKYLPIVPTYGDICYTEDSKFKITRTGIVHLAKNSAMACNYYFNQELEIAQSAPINPIITSTSAIKGHESSYQDANNKNLAYLPYNGVDDETGAQNTPPMRMDNNPQIDAVINGRNKSELDIAQTIGLPDINFGEDASQQSGVSVFRRQVQGETATIHYQSNAEKSIKQDCRVMIDLLGEVCVDPERVVIQNENGEDQEVMINFSELDLDSDDFEIDLTHGAMHETKKREHIAQLLEIAQLSSNPTSVPFLKPLVESTDNPYSDKVIKALDKAYPQFADNEGKEEDPRAREIMDQMTQTIDAQSMQLEELENQLLQAQSALYAEQRSNQVDIAREQIKSETTLVKADKDNETKLQVEAMKQTGESSRQEVEVINDAENRLDDKIEKEFDKEDEFAKELLNKTSGITDYDERRL